MSDELKSLQNYIHAIENKLAMDDATEHTHRAALQALIESLLSGVSATNEPKHIKCGAPDFVIRKGAITVGYIEAKDIGKSLDETEKTDQLKRYLNSLTNLVLTDYLEFRWYVDGQKRLSARLGTPTKDGKIKRDKEGIQAVAELLTTFLDHQAEKVGTPQELAQRMARLAHMIRDLIIEAFKQEAETGGLHNQLAAFRDNLIPDLSTEYFADMYAQTIAYGLFAARCTAPDNKEFTRQNAAYLLPKTNPFLRKLFNTIAGPDLDDRIAWLVDDLAQVLAQADMEAVLKNFNQTQKYIGVSISQKQFDSIKVYTDTFVEQNKGLFEKRVGEGRIRDCHGDLHSAHVCFTDGICIYDCIEFNDRFRYCDVASEIAFLAMDLDFHHQPGLSKHFVGAYVESSQDKELLKLLNFYKCYRAYVRGKVESFKFDDPLIPKEAKTAILAAAKRYFELAEGYV